MGHKKAKKAQKRKGRRPTVKEDVAKKRGSSPTVREGSKIARTERVPSRKTAKTQSVRSPRVIKGSVANAALPHGRASDAIMSFAPPLGDLDLHLFGEGKHERVYEKLGAHVVMHQGKRGVAFAVWAPNADRVSVVGNFNGWGSAKHPMRPLGASGVWELFVPGLRAGELYKYAITNSSLEFFKADPYAFMMEVPPETSSI